MLECSGLAIRYGPIDAIRDCDIAVDSGTIVAILGANGAGKSSLLKAFAGLVPLAAGHIKIDGEDITGLATHQRAKLGISLALEGRRLFHRMTVEENLRLGWEFRQRGNDFRIASQRAYERFPMLASRRSTPAGLLSGGQQQMLILSAALMHEPRYLLLDEPSLGLAPVIVQQIYSVIGGACRDSGTTIILSEQVAAVALGVAHKAYVLRQGKVVHQGSAKDLAKDPSLSAAYLGG
jgi:branched-chain amino acid transport system ATP-binding protein